MKRRPALAERLCSYMKLYATFFNVSSFFCSFPFPKKHMTSSNQPYTFRAKNNWTFFGYTMFGVKITCSGMEISAKNKLDSLFFTRQFVSERKQIALMADEKLLRSFLIAFSRQVAQKWGVK